MELVGGRCPPEEGIEYATLKAQGRRPSMEDFSDVAHFEHNGRMLACFSIFDGHGGQSVAEFCALQIHHRLKEQLYSEPSMSIEDALRAVYIDVDEDLEAATRVPQGCCGKNLGVFVQKGLYVGSTGVTVVVSDDEITMAHVGDSRALLVSKGKLEAATLDHRALLRSESSRILAAGGRIERGMVTNSASFFAQHYLGMTRAFGDFSHKRMPGIPKEEQAVICVPEVKTCPRTENSDFLLIASDGLWCVMYNEDAVDFVSKRLEQGMVLEDCCKELAHEGLNTLGSRDNLTLTLVQL